MRFKKHIAVFDRDPDVLQSAKLVLSEKFTVTTLSNTQDLLKEIKNNHYDLLIADLRLLPICSKKFLEGIKSVSPGMPIIIMGVSIDDMISRDEMINSITDGIILKPFDIDELYTLIENTLAKTNAAEEVE